MSASSFSDRPFVAGSLIGVRAFDVDKLGRLNSPSYHHVFTPGVNEARCDGSIARMTAAVNRLQQHLFWSGPSDLTLGIPPTAHARVEAEKATQHTVAGIDCSCGFYAYFDGGNDYGSLSRVTAVIEGTGTCTVGSRGFRAHRAELKALVIPEPPKAPSRRRTWVGAVAHGALTAWMCTTAVLADTWWLFLIFAVLAVANGVAAGSYVRSLRRPLPAPRQPSYDAGLVMRNYPGVPVYTDLASALADHPLTPPAPEVVTPETHDDFWTRSA